MDRLGTAAGTFLFLLAFALVGLAVTGTAGAASVDNPSATGPAVAEDHAATGTDTTGQVSTTQQLAQTDGNETDGIPPAIRDALPDRIFEELPDELVQTLLGALPDDLSGDIEEQLQTLDDLPDSLINNLIDQILANIPDEFLEDPPDDLVENPPEEIPAALCRAADMAEKENRNNREEWGPTDGNGQIGNENLMVSTNELGTVTVFKYPNPSYADQVKHHAFDRREPYMGSDPNAGALLGVTVTRADGSEQFHWLRDWGPVLTTDPGYGKTVDQRYASEFSDTMITEYRNDSLGLDVRVLDAVPLEQDVFIRDVTVEADEDSPVEDVEVVSYANFNLVDNKDPLIPTQDWCDEAGNDANVSYESGSDAIVYETPNDGPDLPAEMVEQAGPQFAIGTAMAFDNQSTQHQVAGDAYTGNHSNDPYQLLTNGTTDLPGNDEFDGQVSTAMTRDIDFENGEGSARVYLAAAFDDDPNATLGDEAAAKVEDARTLSLDTVTEEKEEWFRQYVADAPMPENAPENVTKVARRAVLSLAQVWDGETENEHGFSGNIVASIATQAPYGADWIRDGAYFNYVLDRYFGENASGQHEWVNKHNRWYMSLQQNRDGECPQHCNDNMQYYDLGLGILPENSALRDIAFDELPFTSTVPEGGWAMNYYANGVPGGPLGGEIDETAYGAWTFWDHYAVTGNESYLQRIYPAIQLVGDRLTEDCVDEETGLQCVRPEDDNVEYTQTATGGMSAYAGLDSAAKAAAEMYQMTGNESYAEDAQAYAQRRDELGVAMEEHYWNEERGSYGSPRTAFPAFFRPLDDPRMQSQLEARWENVNQTFQGEKDRGQYEAKSLIGLGVAAHEVNNTVVDREQIQEGVEWLANNAARADSTYNVGEAWVRETYADGEVDAAVSQPHIWQQTLIYMASLLAYDTESVDGTDRIGQDAYTEWRNNDATIESFEVDDDSAPQGEGVAATVTVRNDAPVEQEYHVTYTVEGPDGQQHTGTGADVGPIAPGETGTTTVSWADDSATTGEYDATVSLGRATPTGDDDTVGAVDIAEDPTALSSAEYRRVDLDKASQSGAFGITQAAQAEFTVSGLTPADGTVNESEVARVSATIENVGDGEGTQTVEFAAGDISDSQELTLDSGESNIVEFSLDTAEIGQGEFTHSISTDDDSAEGTLTVEMADEGGPDDNGDDGNESDSGDGSGPGFGVVAAALAVIGAALLALRRQQG